MNASDICQQKESCPYRTAAWVFAAVVLGAALRLYRLDQQSLWYDDFNSYASVFEPTLRDLWNCVFGVGSVHGEQVPLSYLIQFAWSRVAGTSVYAVRLLPVLQGLIVIPLAFAVARRAFDTRAGIFAAFCVAISPVHIFFSQEPRYCSLLVLTASLSLFAMLKGLEQNRAGWWVMNGAANLLLLWTHLFGAFLLLAEGLYLLLRIKTGWRRAFAWLFAHGMLVLPTVWWVSRVSMPETAYECYRAPNLWELYLDLVGDEAVNINNQVLFSENALSRLPFDAWMGYLMTIPFALGLAWAAWRLWRGRGAQDDPVLLLVLAAVIPVTALGAISILWRPCIFPRYTMYSSIALFALAGGAIGGIPRRRLRIGATGAIFVLIAYQSLHVVPNVTRIQWSDAAQFVASRVVDRDVVFVGWPGGSAETAQGIFEAQYPNPTTPVLPVYSVSQACADLACLFAASPSTLRVWVVFQTNFTVGPPTEFEACVNGGGMSFERTIFPAMGGVSVYRVTPGSRGGDVCGEIRYALALDATQRGNLAWARELVQTVPEGTPLVPVRDLLFGSETDLARLREGLEARCAGREALARGNLESAARAYRTAMSRLPELTPFSDDLLGVLLKLGLGLAERGENAEALKALEEAASLRASVIGWLCHSLMERLRTGEPAGDAVAAVRMFLLAASYEGQPEEEIRRYTEAVVKDPTFAAGYAVLGRVLLSQGKHAEALAMLDRHNKLIGDQAEVWFNQGRALLGLGDKPGALSAFKKCFAIDAKMQADYGRLVELLTQNDDVDTLDAETLRLKAAGVILYPEFVTPSHSCPN